MRFLHTSDWHLGQSLVTMSRQAEHQQFLQWLLATLENERIDVLLVAGDIFDSGTPANHALATYYDFLRDVSRTCCSQVVIVGGNHDSPATLHAPRRLLQAFGVHVIGAVAERPEEQILTLTDTAGAPLAVVCAVPFLRDRDVRRPEPGESYVEKQRGVVAAVQRYYADMLEQARARRRACGGAALPLLATGHLYVAGCSHSEGERERIVGSLGEVPVTAFPEGFAYVALGHLHQAQRVGGRDWVRYSGSPIPLDFSESGQEKVVIVGEYCAGEMVVRSLPVPCFQPLACLRGDLDSLASQFAGLPEAGGTAGPVWVEVQLESSAAIADIQGTIETLAAGRAATVLAIRCVRQAGAAGLTAEEPLQTLDDLTPGDVFTRCLDAAEVAADERDELLRAFAAIQESLQGTGVEA